MVAPLTRYVVQAGTIQGGVNVHDGRGRVVPRQLPAAPGSFAGRRNELAQLTTALDSTGPGGAVVISAIGGTAGLGSRSQDCDTFATAVRTAHHVPSVGRSQDHGSKAGRASPVARSGNATEARPRA